LSQFADDTTMILDGSSASLNKSLEILSDFAQLSGLTVTFDKTKVLWIRKMKYSQNSIKTRWKFKMLGINCHLDLSKIID
jgi:hypothetical protein